MKRIITLLSFSILLGVFGSCARTVSGTVTRTYTERSPISKIKTSTGVYVTYTVDPKASATVTTVTCEAHTIDYIKATRQGGTLYLHIQSPKKSDISINDARIHVTGPAVSSFETESGSILAIHTPLSIDGTVEIETQSGSHFTANHGIICQKLDIEASSGSFVKINAECRNIEIDASSAAKVSVSGKSRGKAEIEASSAANVNLSSFSASKMDIEASSCAVVSHSCANIVNLETSTGAKVIKK